MRPEKRKSRLVVILLLIGLGAIVLLTFVESRRGWILTGRGDVISLDGVRADGKRGGVDNPSYGQDQVKSTEVSKPLEMGKLDGHTRFWGNVVDENGRGLPGAVVKWEARSSPVAASNENRPLLGTCETGSDGMFEVDAGSSGSLRIDSVTKTGFHEIVSGARSFAFGGTSDPHRPDRSNPVSFLLVSDGAGAAQIIHGDQLFQIEWNGEATRIQLPGLDSGSILVVKGHRDESKLDSGRFTWGVDITMQNGALQLAPVGSVALAPVSGYVAQCQFGFDSKDLRWQSAKEFILFLRAADGKYGYANINIVADAQKDGVMGAIDSKINSGGGRIFERR